jgi:hypothetical protein
MAKRIPSRENAIDHYVRRENAERRIGTEATCSKCSETRAQALIPGSTPVICVECDRKRKGRSTDDHHHFAGRANDATTVPVPANDHVADLSERQRDWPRETLENPHGDPLRRAAACLRGIRDILHYLLDKAVFWIATMLEALSESMVAKHGPTWFVGTPLEQFAVARKGV